MKRTLSFILFGIIAVGLIGTGVLFNNQSAQQANQSQNQPMDQLKIKDLLVGSGPEAKAGDVVSALYTGSLDDGTVFDASSKHGNQPFSFTLGAGQVIQGWDLGVVGMKVGGKRELTIPSNLGYGPNGQGPIPPNATLHFTIQLVAVSSTGQ